MEGKVLQVSGSAGSKLNLLEARLRDFVEAGQVPCAVYCVKKNGLTVAEGGWGYRQLVPERHPVTLNTWFDLASLTKVFFASAVMKLVDAGEISLSEPMYRLIPEWQDSAKRLITPWHLLTHTSGYPGQVRLFESSSTCEQLVQAALNLPLRSQVGACVEYSSQGFMVLEEWLQRKGLDWQRTLFEDVLAPLNIEEVQFGPLDRGLEVAATEYCRWQERVVVGEVHDENAVVLGGRCAHAGLFGTVQAVADFGQAILDHLQRRRQDVWSCAAVQTMCGNHTRGLNLNRGLGWQVWQPVGSPGGDLMSPTSFGHTGFTGTSIWIDPPREIVAVLFTNRVHPNRDNEAIFLLRQVFHNLAVSCLENI